MTTIDPDAHQHLIDLQRASTAAHSELLAYNPAAPGAVEDEDQQAERLRLRKAAVEASAAKDAALHASGLVAEFGYHQVNMDLKNAARQ